MAKPRQNRVNLDGYKWSTLELVRSDQDTSFACPSCGSRSHFSYIEASRKNPQGTGQLQPLGQTVRLTSGSAIFFDQIYERQPLIWTLSFMIGIVAVILVIRFWRNTIWPAGVPWWAALLALFGGWAVMRLVQPALSPRLPLWRFNCPECGAGYIVATNGTKARIGDNKGRIIESPILGKKTPSPAEKIPEVKVAKSPEPELPPLGVSRKAVKVMAENRNVEQLIQVAKRGGLITQLSAGKALLEIDDVRGLDALLNETELGRYYERAVVRLESHRSDPRAIEALRRAVSHGVELNKTRLSTPDVGELNKLRRTAAAKALERLGMVYEL